MDELLFAELTGSEDETEALGRRLGDMIKQDGRSGEYLVIAMRGDLGAGKTVFVRGLASVLSPGARVHSPTYTVVNEYGGDPPLFHFDLYRIESEDDLLSVGYDDYLARGVAVLEWSEKLPIPLPENSYTVTIEKLGETCRRITAVRG